MGEIEQGWEDIAGQDRVGRWSNRQYGGKRTWADKTRESGMKVGKIW